ncbi:HypC/HybG/HupF family hydrogenase formation chaperone [bacterium]|nr:HypC/HybG/HupF family hydrogenase formation chaperone [bacterium]
MCLGVPGRIIRITNEDPIYRSGEVDFSGAVKEIALAYTPEAEVDDYVIVHAGFALNVIDEEEAQQVLDDLRQLGELAAQDEAP